MNNFKDKIAELTDEYQPLFEKISRYIFENPELGGEEVLSAEYISNILKEHDFKVETPYESLPTAVIGSYINDPAYENYAFLAEYDALPGYGENNNENAHACGHNWIAASMTGCAIVLSKISKELKINVHLIGTPAEETFGAKCNMIELGAFDNIDFAFQAHMDAKNNMYVYNLAMNAIEFTFRGVPSHASRAPEKGVNALDAVISMFVNVGLLRQQMPSKDRIHGIITNGGTVHNVIPDLAVCRFCMRSPEKSSLEVLKNKVINIAKAAALSTGCSLEYDFFENPFDNMLHIDSMISVTEENFNRFGVVDFAEKGFVGSPGSSDIGNVSYVCPTIYAEIGIDTPESFPIHSNKALEYADSQIAYDRMNQIIKGFCSTVVDISQDRELADRIKEEFKEKSSK